jgi:hypothetical protein
MNVIFLDIDGVLNTTRSAIAQRMAQNKKSVSGHSREFDPVGSGMLRALCFEFGAKIVISSTWRFGADMSGNSTDRFKSALYNNLKENDLLEYIHEDWRTIDMGRVVESCRGDEIEEWLERHKEVTNYVIFDDDVDMLDSQQKNFVNTDTHDGICFRDYLRAEKIFKNEEVAPATQSLYT